MYLQKASNQILPGLGQLLLELGAGENGFGGTSFGTGAATLQEFLQSCRNGEDPAKVKAKFVPQTIFWMMDDCDHPVGMMRVRHVLNDCLTEHGGHVGYYVRRSERGKGYAKGALRLAVEFLKSKGVRRVLVTIQPSNAASVRVALTNGGVLDTPGRNPDTGEAVMRYWIEA